LKTENKGLMTTLNIGAVTFHDLIQLRAS
jgi:hypothetical protein